MSISHKHVKQDNDGLGGECARTLRVKIYTVEGPLSFVLTDITKRAKAWPELNLSALVLRLERVKFIDARGLLVLQANEIYGNDRSSGRFMRRKR